MYGPHPAVVQELQHWYQMSLSKTEFLGYDSGYVVVPNNSPSLSGGTGSNVSFIDITADADFMIEEITGFAYGPTDSTGLALTGKTTDFPNPINTAFAVRGLSIRISDTKNGAQADFMNNPIPLELICAPGYGPQLVVPFKFQKLVKRSTKLKIEWKNKDTKVDGSNVLYHTGFILLKGTKYTVPPPAER